MQKKFLMVTQSTSTLHNPVNQHVTQAVVTERPELSEATLLFWTVVNSDILDNKKQVKQVAVSEK